MERRRFFGVVWHAGLLKEGEDLRGDGAVILCLVSGASHFPELLRHVLGGLVVEATGTTAIRADGTC